MKIELLIINTNVAIFCKTKADFINFLNSSSNIKIKNEKIYRIENKKFDVLVNEKHINTSGKYYSVHISLSDDSEDTISELTMLLSEIKSFFNITTNKSFKFYVVWNDISIFYAKKAYEHINYVENTLRIMILKLMLVSAGPEWHEENIPEDVKSKIDNRKGSSNIFENIIWHMDFIHLSNLLFKSTRLSDLNSLDRLLEEHKNDQCININEFERFLPKNNWQRYFSNTSSIDPDDFKKTWEDLYTLRNKIAHNREFGKNEFDTVLSISQSLINNFNNAINEIENGNIQLSNEDQQNIINGIDVYESIVQELKKSKAWQEDRNKTHPNSFIGRSYFLTLCESKGIDRDRTSEVLNQLEQNNLIRFYTHYRGQYDSYGVYSIDTENLQ